MSEIKAIPTRYKGYHFRSRLEARWAVFFDALGLDWEYEPEGFEWEGKRYLPDFLLRFERTTGESDFCYAEVKPDESQVDWGKDFWLSYEFSNRINSKVLCLIGPPDFVTYAFFDGAKKETRVFPDGTKKERASIDVLLFYGPSSRFFPFTKVQLPLGKRMDEVGYSSPKRAIYAARSARFEYGQCGAT